MNIGETFKTRDGELVTVIEVTSNATHPVVALDTKRRFQKYTREGRYISSEVHHKKDLVQKYEP